MRNTQLLVIGDSHADFWNGTSNCFGEDTIPGVRSHAIHGSLAYNLVEEESTTDSRSLTLGTVYSALADGFEGWFMLTFGAIDCECFIWKYAPLIGFQTAVSQVVARYLEFILEIAQLHPKVAIWAPIATRQAMPHEPLVGSETERNLAILVFTAMLKEQAAQYGVPVISIAESLIAPDGTTRRNLFWDNGHLTQAMMPFALDAVNEALGLALRAHPEPITFRSERFERFETVDYFETMGHTWLRYIFPEGARYITEIGVTKTLFAAANHITVATSLCGATFTITEGIYNGAVKSPKDVLHIPLKTCAKTVLVRAAFTTLRSQDISIYVESSPVGLHTHFNKESLLTLRDQIMESQRAAAATHGALSTVKMTFVTAQGVAM